MMNPEPIADRKFETTLHNLEAFLDRHVLPYPIKFLTNRIVILATLALLIPLIFFAANQTEVNVLNSYLNVMSVVVSSTVLLYATIADVRDRAAAQRREEIAAEYQQVLETRVEAEHVLNEKILELAAQINVQGMQVEHLEKIRSQDRKQANALAREYENVLEKRVAAQELVLEKRVQEEHEISEKILAHAVENSLQNILMENLEKLRTEDREDAAELARAYEQVLEKRVAAQELVLEKRVQAEHELNQEILGHAVENSLQNIVMENLEKLRAEDREHAAGLARAYEQVLEKRVAAQELVLEQRVQAEHELNEKILQGTIENVLGERLKMQRVEEETHVQRMHQELIASLQTYHAEVTELAQLVQTLLPHPSGESSGVEGQNPSSKTTESRRPTF